VAVVWVAVLGLLAAVIGPRVAAAVRGPRL
jgi:hypothetical protein